MLILFTVLLVFNFSVHAKYNTERAACPQDHDCTWIYSYFATQNLKCTSNNQCPKNFLCCPDCHYQHHVCKSPLWLPQKEIPKTRCPKSTTFCKQRFPFLGTKWFKCTTNKECDHDPGFICCNDDCYAHKICKKAVEENVCPKDLKPCSHPLAYEKTKRYKCTAHAQCPKSYACCSDSCYTHKVCKPRPKATNENCPISVRKQLCPNTNRTLFRYSCKTQEDCVYGYICCEDNCYDHKVCKLPNGAFSYRKAYRQQSFTIPSYEEQHKCPTAGEKCTKPYSLRLAKKFICFKDADCKIGQLCCKDSCVKDFRICKTLFTLKPEVQVTTFAERLVLLPEEGISTSSEDSALTTVLASSNTFTAAKTVSEKLETSPSFDYSAVEKFSTSSNPSANAKTEFKSNATTVIGNSKSFKAGRKKTNNKQLNNKGKEEFSLQNLTTSPTFKDSSATTSFTTTTKKKTSLPKPFFGKRIRFNEKDMYKTNSKELYIKTKLQSSWNELTSSTIFDGLYLKNCLPTTHLTKLTEMTTCIIFESSNIAEKDTNTPMAESLIPSEANLVKQLLSPKKLKDSSKNQLQQNRTLSKHLLVPNENTTDAEFYFDEPFQSLTKNEVKEGSRSNYEFRDGEN